METALRERLRDRAVRAGRRRLRGQLLHGDRPRRCREPAAGAAGAAPESGRARDPDRLLRADQPAAGRAARGRLRHRRRPAARPAARRARPDPGRRGPRPGRQPAQGGAGDARSAPRCSAGRRAPSSRSRRAAICSAPSASCRWRAAAAAACRRAACSASSSGWRSAASARSCSPASTSAATARTSTPALTLADLLEMIAEAAPVPRMRLSSIDPPEVTPRLLDADGAQPGALSAPARAGAGRRRRGAAPHAAAVRHARWCATSPPRSRRALPDAALGTDVIAGFPGESDAEFDASAGAARRRGAFTYFHVFPVLAPQRHDGGEGAAITLPPRDHPRAARGACAGSARRKRRAFAERFVGATLDGAGRGVARPRQRPTGRATAATTCACCSTVPTRWRTARCGCGRVARGGRSAARSCEPATRDAQRAG